jgi:hypothetical protein
MLELPRTPVLYMAAMPRLMGIDRLYYAPFTLTTSRIACWTKTLSWADEIRDSADRFDALFAQCPLGAPPLVRRSMDVWRGFDKSQTRTRRITWLKRHGCRVVAGRFVVGEPAAVVAESVP